SKSGIPKQMDMDFGYCELFRVRCPFCGIGLGADFLEGSAWHDLNECRMDRSCIRDIRNYRYVGSRMGNRSVLGREGSPHVFILYDWGSRVYDYISLPAGQYPIMGHDFHLSYVRVFHLWATGINRNCRSKPSHEPCCSYRQWTYWLVWICQRSCFGCRNWFYGRHLE